MPVFFGVSQRISRPSMLDLRFKCLPHPVPTIATTPKATTSVDCAMCHQPNAPFCANQPTAIHNAHTIGNGTCCWQRRVSRPGRVHAPLQGSVPTLALPYRYDLFFGRAPGCIIAKHVGCHIQVSALFFLRMQRIAPIL